MTSEQMSHVVKLREAREDGEREGAIGAFANALMLIRFTFGKPDHSHEHAILEEIDRLYGLAHPRVLYHFALRGFEIGPGWGR